MNKRTIWIIVGSMGIALLGSILLQMYWIGLTFQKQKDQFDREVNLALASVVDNIEGLDSKYLSGIPDSFSYDAQIKIVTAHENKKIVERLGNKKGVMNIDNLLKKAVNKLGTTEYHYGIYSDIDGGFAVIDNRFTVTSISGARASSGINSGLYSKTAYEGKIFTNQKGAGKLVLYLPNRIQIIWSALLPYALASLLFTFLILACFAYTIFIIQRQKKISDMKNDFINNMTHEFKTPIATISLASDSINNPSIINNAEKVQRFTKIISQENKRMLGQVEKVLQMAQLEKKDLQLKLSDINVHELLLNISEHVNLQIKGKKGNLILELNATDPVMQGDLTHISNILYNLLDNANKYTPDTPEITVTTRNVNNGIEISIADNGIGISRDNQKFIFEKFYRVSTGNVHDVKGFGLGLSYVKVMVDAHHGNINVKSTLGKGSTFVLFFPKMQNKNS